MTGGRVRPAVERAAYGGGEASATAALTAVGLVLAAGAGSRYGRPKILVADWLARAVTALRRGGCADVLVVTGAARAVMPDAAAEVHNPGWARGVGTSLRAGLEAAAPLADQVAVHLVDCPDVGAAVVRRVLSAAQVRPGRAVYGGRAGHPVVLPRRYVPQLLAELGDAAGAGDFLRALPTVEVECGDLATGRDHDYASQPQGGPARWLS